MKQPSSHTAGDERAAQLVGEALLFGLLARTLYPCPDREWLEPLAVDDLFEEAPYASTQPDTLRGLALLQRWSAASQDGITRDALVELNMDYLRLFGGLGAVKAPPWESVYFSEERQLFQDRTRDVRARYEHLGVFPQKETNEPDDHIAFEFSFVAHCAALELQAIEQGDERAIIAIGIARRDFLALHLLQWGQKWSELAFDYAETDFYRGMVLLARGGLAELAQSYDVVLPETIYYPGLKT